jgi:hypothetical protein
MSQGTVEYSIDTERQLVAHRMRGTVSAAEVVASLRKVWADPDYRSEMVSLVDLREMEPMSETPDIVAVANVLKEQSKNVSWGKVAVVVSAALPYGMTRMFQAYADPAGIALEIFYGMDEARRWLGVDG